MRSLRIIRENLYRRTPREAYGKRYGKPGGTSRGHAHITSCSKYRGKSRGNPPRGNFRGKIHGKPRGVSRGQVSR